MRYGVVEIGRGGGGDGDGDDDGSRDEGSLVSVCSVLLLAMLLPESRVVVEALAGARVEAASTGTVAKDSSLLLDVDSLGKLAIEAELELDALDREMGEESPAPLPFPDARLDSGCDGR